LNGESFFALFFAEELIILVLIKTVEDPIIKHHYILQLVQHLYKHWNLNGDSSLFKKHFPFIHSCGT